MQKPLEQGKQGAGVVQGRYIVKPLTVFQFIAVTVLMVCAVTLTWKTNIAAAKANRATTYAIVAGWQNDNKPALQYYQKALQYQGAGKYEIRNRFAQWVLGIAAADPKLGEDTQQLIQAAIESVAQNVTENPHDYLPLLYESRLYMTLGRNDPKSEYNDTALELTGKALEISPTFVRTFYEVAQVYLNKEDYANAVKNFQHAVELNPAVGLSWWYWGTVVIQSGDKAEGEKLLDEALAHGYQPSEGDAQRLVNIYADRGDFQKMIPILEQLTQFKPDNAQYWAMLAEVYRRVNRIDDAIAAARKAGELDAKLKDEVDRFIKSLGGTP